MPIFGRISIRSPMVGFSRFGLSFFCGTMEGGLRLSGEAGSLVWVGSG